MLFSNANLQLEEIKLNPKCTLTKKKEIRFLTLLVNNKNLVTTYKMIDDFVYEDKLMTMDGLRALVRRLRTKIQDDIIKMLLMRDIQ